MNYGLQINNENGNDIFNSEEIPYSFTYRGVPITGAYLDIQATQEALITIEYPPGNAESDPAYPIGYYLRVSDRGGGTCRVEVMNAGSVAANTSSKLWVIDRVRPGGVAGYGLEIFDASGGRVLTSAEQLPKIVEFATVSVGLNTPLGNSLAADTLLFAHAYEGFYREGSYLGPWYTDHTIFPGFEVVGGRYRGSRVRRTRYQNPSGWGHRVEKADISFMLIEKPK